MYGQQREQLDYASKVAPFPLIGPRHGQTSYTRSISIGIIILRSRYPVYTQKKTPPHEIR